MKDKEGKEDDEEIPEPDTCHECGELAVGVDECGTPLCGNCYRNRDAIKDMLK